MKKLLFSLMILVLFISCGTKDAADNNAKTSGEIEKIQKRGKLIVGVFTDKPPFGFINEKNRNILLELFFEKYSHIIKFLFFVGRGITWNALPDFRISNF